MRTRGSIMWSLLSLVVVVVAAASCLASSASALGQGQRVTSVFEFPDGRGFRADLEVIEKTSLYGADVNELSMTVRCETRFKFQRIAQKFSRWPRNFIRSSNFRSNSICRIIFSRFESDRESLRSSQCSNF